MEVSLNYWFYPRIWGNTTNAVREYAVIYIYIYMNLFSFPRCINISAWICFAFFIWFCFVLLPILASILICCNWLSLSLYMNSFSLSRFIHISAWICFAFLYGFVLCLLPILALILICSNWLSAFSWSYGLHNLDEQPALSSDLYERDMYSVIMGFLLWTM